MVFAQRWGLTDDGTRYKNYYVPESVGIATGMLITAIHHAGLVCLEHTPNPMAFLNEMLGRPAQEKPVMILPVGYPAADATVPAVAKRKKAVRPDRQLLPLTFFGSCTSGRVASRHLCDGKRSARGAEACPFRRDHDRGNRCWRSF